MYIAKAFHPFYSNPETFFLFFLQIVCMEISSTNATIIAWKKKMNWLLICKLGESRMLAMELGTREIKEEKELSGTGVITLA